MVLLLLITGWCGLYRWASNTLKRQPDVGPVNADVIGSYSRGGKGCWCEPWKWAPFQPLSDLQLKQGLQHFINSLYSFNHSFTIFIHLLIHSPWTGTTALHNSLYSCIHSSMLYQFTYQMRSPYFHIFNFQLNIKITTVHQFIIFIPSQYSLAPYLCFQFSIIQIKDHSTSSIHYINSFPIFTSYTSICSIFK